MGAPSPRARQRGEGGKQRRLPRSHKSGISRPQVSAAEGSPHAAALALPQSVCRHGRQLCSGAAGMYTCIHSCTCTYMRVYKHMYTACIVIHTHAYSSHIHAHTCSYINTNTPTCIHIYMYKHPQTPTHMYTLMCIYTHMCTHKNTHSCVHTHANTCTHRHTATNITYMWAHTCSICVCTPTLYIHMHVCTCSHSHGYTQLQPGPSLHTHHHVPQAGPLSTSGPH